MARFFVVGISHCEEKSAKTLVVQGNLAYEDGSYDEAIAKYTEAIQLDPTYAQAVFGRGSPTIARATDEKAIADLTRRHPA